ncbi:terminase small subunit [Acinetobacter baumannii OIFC0162]|uniref:terminase small subunit n=1 Tax=Acinetobacter baumannii TaxID=470 RepID=UPI00028F0612|nr:terminase small subunit [Acinetobacter baumannii]EHU2650176.1 terminase small subunit [Acinetobacter baumannii]EHU2652380.1 terminase small subunit [Acinetobacter baumannii]EKK05914.1 terminase small subunit [Acinetobacter baumannii OIFC0162]TPS85202.1 terminase small subunit [Acinetobacter baumannii]TPT55059.1 terminase small subunit [Acinetobacter baumannii]
MALRGKQKIFVHEYLKDLNATQAAIRAGYSAKTAGSIGDENLKKPEIQKAIKEAQEQRIKRLNVDADYVLHRLVEIDQMDVLDIMNDDLSLKPISEWTPIWRQYISGLDNMEEFDGRGDDRTMIGYLRKIKWPDKVKNLELLGKHISIGAFKERVELGNDPENPLTDPKAASTQLSLLAKLKKAKAKKEKGDGN